MESMRWLKQISDTGVRTKSKKTTIFRETNWFSKQILEGLLNLLGLKGLRRQHDFFDFNGVALRIDQVQVINAIATPAAEVNLGLLLADGRFVYHRLTQGIGHLEFPTGHAAEIAGIEGNVLITRIGPNLYGIAIGNGIIGSNAGMDKQSIRYGDAGLTDALVVNLRNLLLCERAVPDGDVVEGAV